MNTCSTIKAMCLAACLAASPLAVLADEPATPPAGTNMMGHSPASKEHIRMNDTLNNASQASEAPSAPSNGMGHSPAGKEHIMMNQTANTASKVTDAPASPDNGMGHSPAGKEHVMMKHKHKKAPTSQETGPAQ